MPTFEPAQEAKDDPLRLPIPGGDGTVKLYEIPPLSAADLVTLSQLERSVRMISVGLGDRVPESEITALDRMTQRQHVELVLSAPTFELMCKNRIDARMLSAAAVTAQTWHTNGTAAAFKAWEMLAVHPGEEGETADPKAAKSGGGNTNPMTGSSSSSRHRKPQRRKGKARAGR